MIDRSSCPDPELLAAYVDGLLAIDAIATIDHHIDHCGVCRAELSAIASVIESAPGRYAILRAIGRGSMGIVLRAFDRELERPVAVKLLASATRVEDAVRLRREAQAMARLAHPNVVTVYDVTTHEDAVVIAMELIEGTTLRTHLATHALRDASSWRPVLDVCIAAGRGLAAAHAVHLIHRDFKPENVLCGAGGRVLVSDFGLARRDDEPEAPPVRAGTPAYMAPEVIAGGVATAASDQFSFCVTTYEALYGERPFAGAADDELVASIAAGLGHPTHGRVPPAIRAVLARGLSSDPARRFGSMDALLDALAAGARRRWPRGSRITSETTWRNRAVAVRQTRRVRH